MSDFNWEEFCQTSLSRVDAFALQLPLDEEHRQELLALTEREIVHRWRGRPLADFTSEFVDRLALIRLLGGSPSQQLNSFPALETYRRSKVSRAVLIRQVRALKESPLDRSPLPENFLNLVQILDVADEFDAVTALIWQALFVGDEPSAIHVVARSGEFLDLATRNLILLKIYDLLSKRHPDYPLGRDLNLMINSLSLVQGFENRLLKHQLLWRLGIDSMDGAINDQILESGLRALRLSGELMGLSIEPNHSIGAITRIQRPRDHQYLTAKIDSLFMQRISDYRGEISPLIEVVFALNTPGLERDTHTLAELWQTTLERRLQDLMRRGRQHQGPQFTRLVQRYALASAQLSRLLNDTESIYLLLERVASGQLGPLSHEMFHMGLITQILMQLPKEQRSEGVRRAIDKVPRDESFKFYHLLLTESLRQQSSQILSLNWPVPFTPLRSFRDEAMDRVADQIANLRSQVDSIRRSRMGFNVDLESDEVRRKVETDDDYVWELRTNFLRNRNGKQLLRLARLCAERDRRPGPTKALAVDTYILGLLAGP